MSVPYTNIYVKPFFNVDQRTQWTAFINNQSIFVPEYLYQPVNTDLTMVLEYGIQQLNLVDYVAALDHNFYRKRLTFGNIKTAKGKDTAGNHIYDAVYVEIVDEMNGANQSVTMHNQTYYPSTIDNMRIALEEIQVPNTGSIQLDTTQLPKFMKTTQLGNYRPTGYIPVVVLCYALPMDGTKIISRIRKSKFNFTLLDFEVDRVFVEQSLDNTADKYLLFARKSITDIH